MNCRRAALGYTRASGENRERAELAARPMDTPLYLDLR
jgi:hypothetical protein